jgi:hypothetical protein
MGSTTPIYAFPYPVGTDRVMDGDNAIEALARAVEGTIKCAVATLSTNATGDGSITFPTPFPTAIIAGFVIDAHDSLGIVHYKYLSAYSDRTRIAARAYQGNAAILPNYGPLNVVYLAIGK